jgi:L-alanine-DL-glutamate epimerase-like enolase superfamily enzyme
MGTLTSSATHHGPGVQSTRPSTRRLVRSGAVAGAVAAVCTAVVAAIARAADVSLEIDGTAIPIPAFAWWTIVGAALGVVLARLLRDRRRFVVVATVAVGLSLIPAIAAPDDTATKAVLVGIHLLAAAIIIPTLSRQLAAVDQDREPTGDGTDRGQPLAPSDPR